MLVHPEVVVAEQLRRIGAKFGSAKLLANVVEQFGLFHGVVETDEDGWSLRQFYDNEKPLPSCHAEDGLFFPTFSCVIENNQIWVCKVGFGTHDLFLGFDIGIGLAVEIQPDGMPSERCWNATSIPGRVKEIQRMIEDVDYLRF